MKRFRPRNRPKGFVLLLALTFASVAAQEASVTRPVAPLPANEEDIFPCFPVFELEILDYRPSRGETVTRSVLGDLVLLRLEDVLPATGQAFEKAGVPIVGQGVGTLKGLPITTIIDPATVERIFVQSVGADSSGIEQTRAAARNQSFATFGLGDGGVEMAKLEMDYYSHWGYRRVHALVTQVSADHEDWGASGDLRLRLGTLDTGANLQWREIEGYGRMFLVDASAEYGTAPLGKCYEPHFRVEAAWHRLDRDDFAQFAHTSATARLDGLGFFNLDLLTAPVRRIEDQIVRVELPGLAENWGGGRHRWNLSAQWHRRALDWVWPVEAAPTDLGLDTLEVLASDHASFLSGRLALSVEAGSARYSGMLAGGHSGGTCRWSIEGGWQVSKPVGLFVSLGQNGGVSALVSGELELVEGRLAVSRLPASRRDTIEIGGRASLFWGALEGMACVFHEGLRNSAYRDWAWEAAHPQPMATAGGGWITPNRYQVVDWLRREGWRTEWTYRGSSSLSVLFNWSEDWKNEGPVTGGNHRGMLQARYGFNCGYLRNWTIGGGFDYRNQVRFNDGYRLAGGVNWNLMLGFERRLAARLAPTLVRFSLRNLGGNEYQPTRFADDRARQLLVTASQEF